MISEKMYYIPTTERSPFNLRKHRVKETMPCLGLHLIWTTLQLIDVVQCSTNLRKGWKQ